MKIKVTLLLFFAVVAVMCVPATADEKMSKLVLKDPILTTVDLDSIVYLPKDYGKDPEKKWPLVLFLHGAGERGEDVNRVEAHGLPKLAAQGQEFEFIIIAPQCPTGKFWPCMCDSLMAILKHAEKNYAVDSSRVYLTGLSMGGYGSWALASTYPEHFAAVIPICGGGIPYLAPQFKNLPVWAFHGELDNVVPVNNSKMMVDAINNAGGNAKLTIYPDKWHDSWTVTYDNPEVYRWMLEQVLASDE